MPRRATKAAIVTQQAVGVRVDPASNNARSSSEQAKKPNRWARSRNCAGPLQIVALPRSDLVVGVGGGVVTDVAGFAAAVYHRGVAVAHVATTLLAQVDAAIGGKTGVNLPEGKNLVGAFWQPVAVICDTEVLSSLPPREYRSGLGEMAKYAFLGAPELAQLDLDEAVARSVELKAKLVAADERETATLAGEGQAAAGRCSTTGTLWLTPSKRWKGTTCATGRPSLSGSFSRPGWPANWTRW